MELIDLLNSVIISSIANDLTQMVNFPTWMVNFPNFTTHSRACLDLFLSSDASICSIMAFSPLGNSVVVSVSIDFPSNYQRDAPFHCIAYDYSCAIWDGLRDHFRDVSVEDIFKLSASVAGKFCEWVQLGIDVYIPHRKYQAKPHSWFSIACVADIVLRNYFFCLYQQNKSSESKVKFRQAINSYKRALEAAKLLYANSTKESILFQKLGSRGFRPMANKVLNKGKSLYLLHSTAQRCCGSKLFAENFSKNSKFDDSGISLPDFPSRTNLKLHNITVSHKMVKKVIMNLDFSIASGPDCIPVV